MSKQQTVVLVGGGHAHALLLRQWARHPRPDVALHVFDPHPTVTYTGMLPGLLAGHYSVDDLSIDLRTLTQAAGGVFHAEAVTALEPAEQVVETDAASVTYDVASLDIGNHTTLQHVSGASEHTVGVKPLTELAQAWEVFLQRPAQSSTPTAVTIIGGGIAGVEIALAIAHRLQQVGRVEARVTIVECGALLASVNELTKRALQTALERYGVVVHEHADTTTVTATEVTLSDRTTIPSDLVLLATGPRSYEWVARTALPSTDGYVNVDASLASPAYPNVFAVGDCAHFLPRPLPKAGVYAVRQAPILYHNLNATLSNTPLRRYHPQSDYLQLISLGEQRALATKWGVTLEGKWVWHLKDHIDSSFMRQFDVSQ